MSEPKIPFHRPFVSGKEAANLSQVLSKGEFDSEGWFVKNCEQQLRALTGAPEVMMTPSCTDALEMAALLCDLEPGDEVVMPSFTFVSSANPFVLRGARLVFADLDPHTMNLDPACAEAAIGPRTKAIVVTHYGGVAADLGSLKFLAEKHKILLIEDAAHAIGATWNGQHLGTIGHVGTLSFHSSKNVHCAEGGALLINDNSLAARAAILHDKGTDRQKFMRGEVGQYTWVGLGSSFSLSELNAAFLSAQLESVEHVNEERRQIRAIYQMELEDLEKNGHIELAVLPGHVQGNAHVFYLKCKNRGEREKLIRYLSENGVDTRFHYIPLHSAPAGLQFGRFSGEDLHTTPGSERLLRLPIYAGLGADSVLRIAALIHGFYAH